MSWLDTLLTEEPDGPVPVLPSTFDPTLEALCAGLPQQDARDLREERAGILEHQAGMNQKNAERMAGLHPVPLEVAS